MNVFRNTYLSITCSVVLITSERIVLTRYNRENTTRITASTSRITPTIISEAPRVSERKCCNPFVTGSMTTFNGLVKVTPPAFWKISVRNTAAFSIIWKASSRGRNTTIVNKLKKSCIVAAVNALLKSSFLVTKVRETRTFVIVVPMFAPITIGMAASMDITPLPASPTINEVVVDELWIILVTRIPVKRPAKGLEYKLISCSAKSLPNSLKEVPVNLIPSRKI